MRDGGKRGGLIVFFVMFLGVIFDKNCCLIDFIFVYLRWYVVRSSGLIFIVFMLIYNFAKKCCSH